MEKVSHLGCAYGIEGTKHRPFMKAANAKCHLIMADCLHTKREDNQEDQSMALFDERSRFSKLDYSLQVCKQFALKIYKSKQ